MSRRKMYQKSKVSKGDRTDREENVLGLCWCLKTSTHLLGSSSTYLIDFGLGSFALLSIIIVYYHITVVYHNEYIANVYLIVANV